LLFTACSSPVWLRSPPPAEAEDLAAFHTAWETYANAINSNELQHDCVPRLIPAATTVKRHGAVIMFHGFSGCPQQYFTLAAQVAAHGYDVLLPLHPGHGMKLDSNGDDVLSRLPKSNDGQNGYGEFAVRMNDIMARSPGEKIVVGFSLGGAIALNASLNAPNLYDRQLLLSPMLAIRGGAFVEGLIATLGKAPGLRNMVVKPMGTRNLCEKWYATGRAGFCDYRLKDVIALLEIEDINDTFYEEHPPTLPIQIIIAGDEKFVSNPRIEKLVEQQRKHGPISLCSLPEDVPHEMLSPYENRERHMHWLDGLLLGAVGFIVEGKFLASEPNDEQPTPSASACRPI